MDLTLTLRAFVRTVERGSVTAAARDLGVSQPAVSKLLRNLEREVQARLLERNSRSLRPTPQGLRLYQDVSGALSTVEAAIETARSETSRMEGTLRLHSPVCLGERHVQEIAFAFQDRHPGISIELVLENRMPDLIHENMDLAFAIEQPRTEATICRRVGTVRRLLVASRDYAARHGMPIEPRDLARHPIIATDIALGARARWRCTPPGHRSRCRFVHRWRPTTQRSCWMRSWPGVGLEPRRPTWSPRNSRTGNSSTSCPGSS